MPERSIAQSRRIADRRAQIVKQLHRAAPGRGRSARAAREIRLNEEEKAQHLHPRFVCLMSCARKRAQSRSARPVALELHQILISRDLGLTTAEDEGEYRVRKKKS